jgi:aminopeptidase N
MQRTALALAALLAGCASQPTLTDYTVNSGAQRSPAQQALSFEHADLGLRIDPASRSLRGDATLTFSTSAPLDSIELDLDRNLPIDAIVVDGQPLAASQWRNPDGKLTITLPQRLEPGRQVTVRVTYHGEPHVAKRAPWDGGFVWARTPDGQPWVASAVEGEGCDLFWPCIDHPTGKPKVVDEHITVPAPLVAAGNGVAMGMDGGERLAHVALAREESQHLRHLHQRGTVRGAVRRLPQPLRQRSRCACGTCRRTRARRNCSPSSRRCWISSRSTIGPYPFGDEKMGVVETPHKGMEHQTINAYGNKYVKTPYGYDDLLQHEFAHEWFGNQLTNANWDDMWLHEGLGSYMQPLYMQYLRGDQEYFAALMQQRAGIRNKAPLVSGKPRWKKTSTTSSAAAPARTSTTRARSCCTPCAA